LTGRPLKMKNWPYRVVIFPAAQKQILAFSREDQIRAAGTIDNLIENPRPKGCKKLKGTDLWRVRDGQLRIIYSIFDKELRIVILKVAKRQEDTYKHLS
jgi:mRNA interferase RelE/StbE